MTLKAIASLCDYAKGGDDWPGGYCLPEAALRRGMSRSYEQGTGWAFAR